MSVLLFDIDNFKGYNDTFGHQAGDECLKSVAKAIADATANTTGMSARYGGEEFAIILPNVSEANAMRVAEAVRLTVRSLGIPNPRLYPRLCHGQHRRSPAGRKPPSIRQCWLATADLALYEAKRLGRNRSFAASSLKHVFVESGPLQFSPEPENSLPARAHP